MNIKLSHIGLLVSDIEATKKFYCDLLGYEEIFHCDKDGQSFMYYLKNRDDEYLEIFDKAHGAAGFPPQNVQHYCYLVDDLQETGRYFQEKGYKVYYLPSYTGQEAPIPFVPRIGVDNSCVCFIDDPDGNEVEFMQYTKDSLQFNKPKS